MIFSARVFLCGVQIQFIVLNVFFLTVTNGLNFTDIRQNSRKYRDLSVRADEPNWACECGISSVNRIVGGTETAPHRFPWLVFLQIRKNGQSVSCGGFLVTDQHIVTAAHCTYGAPGDSVTAIMGVHNIAHPEFSSVKIGSSQIRNHPAYNSYENGEDIAVVTLKTPVKFSATIRPLCLPTGKKEYSGQQAVIAGWGNLREAGESSDVLMESRVEVWNNDDCKATFAKRGITITDTMICAGGENNVGTCQGDSGGPLMFEENGKFSAIGVVSFGIGCARPNIPGVFSRMDNLLQFVNGVIGATQSCP